VIVRSVAPLGAVPEGIGAVGTLISVGERSAASTKPQLQDGELVVRDDLVFRLFAPDDEPGVSAGAEPGRALAGDLPAAPLPELGSPELAVALASRDYPGVLEALAYGVAVVPVAHAADGLEARGHVAEDGGLDFHIFSSAATLEAFVGDDADRAFVIRAGAAIIDFVTTRADQLSRLVIDAAGPKPMPIRVADLVAMLSVPADSEAGEAATGEAGAPELPDQIAGFDVPLDANWGVLDLTDATTRVDQIKQMVKEQTRSLSDQGASLRQDMRGWLARTADQAASAGGRQFAFLLARTKQAAAAVTMVSYWHELGAGVGAESPIDRLGDYLVGSAEAADELVKLSVEGDQIIRHTRTRRGNSELGGKDISLLLIDYWIAVPQAGASSLAQVSFSTPHVSAREAILALSDSLVLAGHWVAATEVAA
jgi:hypothetical protein